MKNKREILESDNFSGKEWKMIPNHKGYFISESGDVYNSNDDRILEGSMNKQNGYHRVNIQGKSYHTHMLVCTAFYGDRPTKKHEVDHINRCRTWNHVDNLRWILKSKQASNRSHKGTKAKQLSYDEWKEIIEYYITYEVSQYKLRDWANKRFNRNSGTQVYGFMLLGRTYKEYFERLSSEVKSKIQVLSDQRNPNK